MVLSLQLAANPCVLRVGVIGINYKTAEIHVREEMARIASHLHLEESVLLSTCNRTEIYFSSPDLAKAHCDFLAQLRTSMGKFFEQRFYSLFGIECFSHLCRVTSGLDSALVGETEIQRQVKLAYARAGKLPSCMHFCFQKALKVGKLVRNHLELEKGALTLQKAIWRVAESALKDLKKKRFLFVGYSETNRSLISFFYRRGVGNIHVCTQSPKAVQLPATAHSRKELNRWDHYDVIICAAKTDAYLIDKPNVKKNLKLIFDLSMPRSVDPEVNGNCVSLWNIEELDQHIAKKRLMQTHHIEECEGLLLKNVQRLSSIYRDKLLKVGMPRKPGEGDHIADVFHSGSEKDKPFKTEPESGVGDGAVFSEL